MVWSPPQKNVAHSVEALGYMSELGPRRRLALGREQVRVVSKTQSSLGEVIYRLTKLYIGPQDSQDSQSSLRL
jgi:hypothetical protein